MVTGRIEEKTRVPAVLCRWIMGMAVLVMPCVGSCATTAREGSSAQASASAQRSAPLPGLPAPALSLDDIVVLARKANDPDAVIARIREAGAYYRLSAAEVVSLRDRGLPLTVIDHILSSERRFLAQGAPEMTVGKEPERAQDARPRPLIPALYFGL